MLKDNNIRSIWTYLTASPCYTTNRKTDRQSNREREMGTQREKGREVVNLEGKEKAKESGGGGGYQECVCAGAFVRLSVIKKKTWGGAGGGRGGVMEGERARINLLEHNKTAEVGRGGWGWRGENLLEHKTLLRRWE